MITSSQPVASRFHASSASSPAGTTPDQNETTGAPMSAAIAIARRSREIRSSRPSESKRRLVLAAGVEQEACAGLDDHGEAQVLEATGDRVDLRPDVAAERVEVVVVEGEPDAVVPAVREERERVVQAVVGQPVRDVAVAKPGIIAVSRTVVMSPSAADSAGARVARGTRARRLRPGARRRRAWRPRGG